LYESLLRRTSAFSRNAERVVARAQRKPSDRLGYTAVTSFRDLARPTSRVLYPKSRPPDDAVQRCLAHSSARLLLKVHRNRLRAPRGVLVTLRVGRQCDRTRLLLSGQPTQCNARSNVEVEDDPVRPRSCSREMIAPIKRPRGWRCPSLAGVASSICTFPNSVPLSLTCRTGHQFISDQSGNDGPDVERLSRGTDNLSFFDPSDRRMLV
jgi:hypothetical protein